ncbi:uncharacterized protein [Littorina saxatilis]|uniref:Uncharacterized protein n=1 Tax=Littorina saxatilis TaxID=31220 RepID=A0AAN9B6L8_9CAEN
MWTAAVFVGGVFFALAISRAEGQYIHFNLTDGDCSENSTVASQCSSAYQNAIGLASTFDYYTIELDCILMTETIACIETALCHCDFSSDHPQLEAGYRTAMILYHYFNNLTQCSNETYGDSIQSDVFGAVDVTEGVNCSMYNRTAGDLSLSLAVSQIGAVQEVEALCAGVQECYVQYDRGLERALYRKNWPEFCQQNALLLECLVNVSCECGQSAHETVVGMVNTERQIYRQSCAAIVEFGTITEIGIRCPGADLCDSPDPSFDCLKAFEQTATTAATLPEYCTSLYALANCTEDLACQCGFYQEPGYYRSLAISKHNYIELSNCEPVTGPFPNHTGFDCGTDNRFSEAEKILSIALAEPAYVATEEASCPGIKACYDVANAKSSEAHRMKDLTEICMVDSERISCVEAAYCHCGRLNEPAVYNRLYEERLNQGNLCYAAADFPALTRCRGTSTCQQSDPLAVCQAEYVYDSTIAGSNYELQCRSTKNYITCTEQVGCACGLLSDATSAEAATVYNFTTLSLKIYDDSGCPRLSGGISPDEEGITCAGEPNDATRKRLVLSYADSSEVAALAGQCKDVRGCFDTHDTVKGSALVSRNYNQLCQAQATLFDCVDKAYCGCKLNGTAMVESYITTQITAHEEYCANISPISRKPCLSGSEPTGSAERMSVTSVVALLTLLATVIVKS